MRRRHRGSPSLLVNLAHPSFCSMSLETNVRNTAEWLPPGAAKGLKNETAETDRTCNLTGGAETVDFYPRVDLDVLRAQDAAEAAWALDFLAVLSNEGLCRRLELFDYSVLCMRPMARRGGVTHRAGELRYVEKK